MKLAEIFGQNKLLIMVFRSQTLYLKDEKISEV